MAKTRSEKVIVLSGSEAEAVSFASRAEVAKKNAESEYDAARQAVIMQAENLRDGADTLRLQTEGVTALVSFTDKVVVDVSKPGFKEVAQAVERGSLEGVISKTTVARITPSALGTVLAVLKAAGVDLEQAVTVETGYVVSPEGLRQAEQMVVSSPERAVLLGHVKCVVSHSSSCKVTFKAVRE